jgi:hypothetical protein
MLFGLAVIAGLLGTLLWLALREPGQDRNYP